MSSKFALAGSLILGGLYYGYQQLTQTNQSSKTEDVDDEKIPNNEEDRKCQKNDEILRIQFPEPNEVVSYHHFKKYQEYTYTINNYYNFMNMHNKHYANMHNLVVQKDDDIKINSEEALPETMTIQFSKTMDKIRKLTMNKANNAPHIVFIHGFNNSKTFVDKRIEFIEKQIGPDNVIITHFEWPSAESVIAYHADKSTALFYGYILFEYLETLIHSAKISKLYIMAHSMGNCLLSKCLSDHRIHIQTQQTKSIFTELKDFQIVSIAADCDRKEFADLIKKLMDPQKIKIYGISKWTHYFNKYDKALKLSKSWMVNKWQSGAAGLYKINNCYRTVVSIDCSAFSYYCDFNHSYIDTEELCKDISLMVCYEIHEFQRDTLELVCHHTNEFKLKKSSKITEKQKITSNKNTNDANFDFFNFNQDFDEEIDEDIAENQMLGDAEWHRKMHGEGLSFINSQTVTLNEKPRKMGAVCLLNCALTPQVMVNKIDLHLKIIGVKLCIFIGYVESINDWDSGFGMGQNKRVSTGVVITDEDNIDRLILCDSKNHSKRLEYQAKFKSNDIFILSFDFNNDILQIYHNNHKADHLSLNGLRRVVPGVVICNKNNTVQILKCVGHADNFYE